MHIRTPIVGRINGGFDRPVFSPDGISNDEYVEEEDVWEENENSRTTSVKFTDDVENEKTKEVRVCLYFREKKLATFFNEPENMTFDAIKSFRRLRPEAK